MFPIRPATPSDDEAILSIWHEGWHDAHAALVPEAILPYRTPDYFRRWLAESTDVFHVATVGEAVLGFVAVKDGELVKLYIARAARGNGLALALMHHALNTFRAEGREEARLYCTKGNLRAQRFYEREGWRLARSFIDRLWLPEGIAGHHCVGTHDYRYELTAGDAAALS